MRPSLPRFVVALLVIVALYGLAMAVIGVVPAPPEDKAPGIFAAQSTGSWTIENPRMEAAKLAAQTMIRAFGYDCRSVDLISPRFVPERYLVYCNHYQYEFEIMNHGGRWSVTAN